MEEQKKKTNQKSDLQIQKDILERLAFGLDLEGSKLFSILEKDGEIFIIDTGISGKSIVNLIVGLATRYEPFFTCAIEILTECEDDMKNSKQAFVN